MSTVTVDRLLAVLVVAMAATGLATLRAGTPSSAGLFVLHGVIAGALALTVLMKLRSSVGRAARRGRWGRLLFGSIVGFVAIAALSGGYLWVAGGALLSVRGWTVLTLHAWAGLVLVPLVIVHVLPRRWLLLRPWSGARRSPRTGVPGEGARSTLAIERIHPSRRTLLASASLVGAGIGAWIVADILDRVQGGIRRFTGSRPLPPGGVPPPTTFFGEPAPHVDGAAWRVTIRGLVAHNLTLDRVGLATLGTTTRSAILDCTSGWSMETDWSGTPLSAVLDAADPLPAAREVIVRSATGWSAIVPLDEARGCLLATTVAGGPLPVGNGYPCRLVVPDRRGLDWVKWVTEIEVV